MVNKNKESFEIEQEGYQEKLISKLKSIITAFEAKAEKPKPKKAIGRSVTHRDNKGNPVLKTTQTPKKTLKIEILVEDEEIQKKIMDYSMKLTKSTS